MTEWQWLWVVVIGTLHLGFLAYITVALYGIKRALEVALRTTEEGKDE